MLKKIQRVLSLRGKFLQAVDVTDFIALGKSVCWIVLRQLHPQTRVIWKKENLIENMSP